MTALLFLFVPGLVLGQTSTLVVDGRSNIFGAGHASPPAPGGGGGGLLPPFVSTPAGSDLTLTFSSVTGTVSCCSGLGATGPEGGTYGNLFTTISSVGGISGITHTNRFMFLIGLFLDDAEPAGPGPASLTFSDPENFTDLYPLLGQTFFIGDGLTDSDGQLQQFHVPAGATRLFLGFGDVNFGTQTGWYDDNTGAETASFSFTPPLQAGKMLGDPSCNAACGDPIDIATGNLYEQVTDYATQGPNVLGFSRFYNSGANLLPNPFAATFGLNWRGSFDRYIQIGASTASVERADGRILTFALNNGVWNTDSDVELHLTQSGSLWTLTGIDDITETYSPISTTKAVLTKIQQRNGYTQTLNYDSNNRLAAVTDSFARTLTFTYAGGFLHTLSTPDGQTITYDYEASISSGPLDRLASATYSAAPLRKQTYRYENPTFLFALTGLFDENGKRYTTWTYDTSGRATSSEHASGADKTTITYNANGSRTVTNALGLQTVYTFTPLQGVAKVTETKRLATGATAAATSIKTYDANGYLASQTDWNGNRTQYVNDSRGLPTTITEAPGTPQVRTTTITYDTTFHLPVKIVKPGLTTDFTYDSAGNLIKKVETDTTTTTEPYSTNGSARTWSYTWSNGLLRLVLGPRENDRIRYDYDASGTLIRVTNALGQVTQTTQHTPGGLPLTIIDPNGVTTTLTYDERLRPITSTITTSAGPLTTTHTYDPSGNLLKTTLPDGSALSSTYDDAHRVIDEADLFGQHRTHALDALGNRKRTTITTANAEITRTHDAVFDALGRMIEETGGEGQTTKYALDSNGNVITITDALGHVTQQFFDPLNRLFKVIDPALGVTITTYDENDRPLSVTVPNGAVTTYVYNGFGDRLQTLSPDSGKTVYRFDALGNVTEKVDATGATADSRYDALGRIVTATYSSARSENVVYRYDEPGHGFGIGRLTSVADAAGTLKRSYDERGNVTGESRVSDSAQQNTAYGFDAAGRLTSVGYPSGASVGYVRDIMGRVTNVAFKSSPSAAAVPVLSGISYEPFGALTGFIFGNGIKQTEKHDLDYRLTNLTATGVSAIQNVTYGYDAADNVKSIADAVTPGNSQSFDYDLLDQLTSATGSYGSRAYTYDSAGNRLSEQAGSTLSAYAYTPNSNRLTQVATSTALQNYGYTAAGNISSVTSAAASLDTAAPRPTTLVYNQAGRLASVRTGVALQLQYTYDVFGHRVGKTGATTGKTIFQYDLVGHLLEDSDAAGNARVDYIYLDDRPIATYQPSNGKLYYLHTDRLGTPQVATDSAQVVAWSANYEPFGSTHTGVSTIAQNLRLPGQEFEVETGWNHNGFRDYAPHLGRYLESDPIGLMAGSNTYAYGQGNPLSRTDRLGLEAESDNSGGLLIALAIVIERTQRSMNEFIDSGRFGPATSLLTALLPANVRPWAIVSRTLTSAALRSPTVDIDLAVSVACAYSPHGRLVGAAINSACLLSPESCVAAKSQARRAVAATFLTGYPSILRFASDPMVIAASVEGIEVGLDSGVSALIP